MLNKTKQNKTSAEFSNTNIYCFSYLDQLIINKTVSTNYCTQTNKYPRSQYYLPYVQIALSTQRHPSTGG